MPIRMHDGSLYYSFHEAPPTAEERSDYLRQLVQWCAAHPATFIAPQPAKLPWMPKQSGTLNPTKEFEAITAEVEAGTYKLPHEVESTAGLLRFTAIGRCLAPVLQDGDAFWVDPNAQPEDGDFVAVLISPETYAGFQRSFATNPKLHGIYGGATKSIMMSKRLRALGESWYLTTNTGSFPLEGNKVCGVVRKIERGAGGGVACRPGLPTGSVSGRRASCSALPATIIYTDTLSSVGPTSGETNPLEITVVEAGTFEIAVSALFTVNTFTTPDDLVVALTAPGGSGSFQELIWTTYPITSSGQRVECILRNTYTTTGSGPWTIRFGFADGGGGNTFTATAMSMRVTVSTM